MMPSVNPNPPFTSCSLASGDTSASSAGSSLATAGLSPCACTSTPQTPRVANRTAVEIDKFFMRPRSHPQNSSDLSDIWARLQAVGDDRLQRVLDGLAHSVQSFP